MKHDRHKALLVAAALLMAACSGSSDGANVGAPTPLPTPRYCVQAPTDRLCSDLPHDVLEELDNGYSQLSAAQQRPFDEFSWQSFVALNWPADPSGEPLSEPIGSHPRHRRVWEHYRTPVEVFGAQSGGRESDPPACDGVGDREHPVLMLMAKRGHNTPPPASFLETTGQPLVDRNLNFALFDVRMNAIEVDYILGNELDTKAGQEAFDARGDKVSFPTGFYADETARTGGLPGAVELKATWRILLREKRDDFTRYYHQPARVFVPGSENVSGEDICFEATLGLVAFHLIQRTSGPPRQDQDWMWSTFEHIDNAPLADDPAAADTFQASTDQCASSSTDGWSFFNPACTDCTANEPPALREGESSYLWNASPPWAARYATDDQYGTQVVACREIYSETADLNALYHERLEGTVWTNYRLINTQWQGGIEDPETENGNIPRFLGNPVVETYIQGSSSCLECHAQAETATGADANFSFLLGLAR